MQVQLRPSESPLDVLSAVQPYLVQHGYSREGRGGYDEIKGTGHRQQVDAFHRAALDAGGKDNGAPGLRPNYSGKYYAAFVIGPDNIEVVCHESEF